MALLVRCPDQDAFLTYSSEGWYQYQRFLFTYHALLVHANDYYEKQSVNAQLKLSPSKTIPQEQFSVLPVAALGLKIYKQLVLTRFHNRF